MTPQHLKNSILQLAIQGKLVEQRPEEGVAEVPAAPKHGGKEARRHGEIDPPFDIPESWRWVRLGDVALIERGSGIKRSETSPTGVPCVRYGEIYTTYGYTFTNTKSFVPESVASSCHMANHGDVLCTLTGEWKEEIAKATAYLGNGPIAIGGDLAKISSTTFNPVLLVYFFFSPFMIQQKAAKANGTMIVHIGKDAISNLPIPLPPLAEQKRIVSKIEELLPLLARYEQAWTKLEAFNARFPADLQKSLLQLAIQGKLVEQRPEEGAAEVPAAPKHGGKEARRHGEEIDPPFDIPESWRWVRLGEVADVQLGKMLDKGKNKGTPHPYLANLSVRWRSFDLSALRKMPFTEPECEKFALQPGDVLMCEGGVPGRCAVWRQAHSPIKYQKAVHRIRSAVLFPDFIQLYFEAIVDNTWFADQFTGTTIKHLPRERLIQTPVPLPPLAEQKRIVAKLEELLPLCERLK